ncbi:MAG: DUF3592 domain-containing protein [Planctomycetes bacterium]|nr:DUF3592 domain-containing protein [Planctomycetota bacterium]
MIVLAAGRIDWPSLLCTAGFSALMIGLGAWILRRAAREARLRLDIAKWPTTRGQVLGREVRGGGRREVTHADPTTGVTHQDEVRDAWGAWIDYSYEVGNRTFGGERQDFAPTEAAARRLLSAWPKRVLVYYNPDRPSESYLRRPLVSSIVGYLFLGMFFLAIGALAIAITVIGGVPRRG